MTRVRAIGFVGAIMFSAHGCVTLQDLGSHGVLAEGGAPTDGAPPSTIDGPSALDGPVVPRDSGNGGKLFFVTDNLYSGNLASEGAASTGLAGADAICGKEAKDAGIPGVFKAWLSTASENAKDRIASVGPWWMGGEIVFDGMAVDLPLRFPASTAKGVDLFFDANATAWTGTDLKGKATALTCGGWASATGDGSYGDVTKIGGGWTDYQGFGTTSVPRPCSARLRLYCFEQ